MTGGRWFQFHVKATIWNPNQGFCQILEPQPMVQKAVSSGNYQINDYIQILSFSYLDMNSSSSSSYSHCSCIHCHLTIAIQSQASHQISKTSTHSKFIGTCHTNTSKFSTIKKLHWHQTKNRLQNLSSHSKQQIIHIVTIVFHVSVSTRSSDSLVLSI